jgi:ABC-2 type transport system ATP-binding protein
MPTSTPEPERAGLEVVGLTKRFGDLVALDDVSLAVRPGEIVGFLGPNGAGKTTTMRAIMDLITVDAGTVSWHGSPLDREVRRRFGYMPAERGMYPRMRVRDHLVYYAALSGLDRDAAGAAAERWLERLGLTERANDPIQSLSSGNQQRVQLALALLGEPEALVLDEPFSGLDPIAVDMLSDVLREQVASGVALLLSSHQLDLVSDVCHAVVIVDHGRVVLRGSVDELRSASPVRHVSVTFAAPTAWRPDGATVDGTGRHLSWAVPADREPRTVLDEAAAHGEVTAFSLVPPDLSDVFHRAVGRAPEDPDRPIAGAGADGSGVPGTTGEVLSR